MSNAPRLDQTVQHECVAGFEWKHIEVKAAPGLLAEDLKASHPSAVSAVVLQLWLENEGCRHNERGSSFNLIKKNKKNLWSAILKLAIITSLGC